MKKTLLIMLLGIIFLSCDKDNFPIKTTDCVDNHELSFPIDLTLSDSAVSYTTGNGMFNQPYPNHDTLYRFPKINPTNKEELIFLEVIQDHELLIKYNTCNRKRIVLSNLTGINDLAWADNNVLFIRGKTVYSIDGGGNEPIQIINLEKFPLRFWTNNSGNKLTFFYNDYPEVSNEIYSINGELLYTFSGDQVFIGWYDDDNFLLNKGEELWKINAESGDETMFLNGKYFSYDNYTNYLIGKIETNETEVVFISNDNGELIHVMAEHLKKGIRIISAEFLNNEKLIVYAVTHNFNPEVPWPTYSLIVKELILIMSIDGSNVVQLNPF